MSVISDLLEQIRGRRKAKLASVAELYDAAVRAIARGEEVDADHLGELMDALDKSDSDLTQDVNSKQRIIELVRELDSLKNCESDLEKAEKELRKQLDELSAIVLERQAKIDALKAKVSHHRQQCIQVISSKAALRNIAPPQYIQDRQESLKARRKAWAAESNAYNDAIELPKAAIHAAAMKIEVIDQRLRVNSSVELRAERAGLVAEQQQQQSVIDSLSKSKAALDRESALIETEQREIDALLLNP